MRGTLVHSHPAGTEGFCRDGGVRVGRGGTGSGIRVEATGSHSHQTFCPC